MEISSKWSYIHATPPYVHTTRPTLRTRTWICTHCGGTRATELRMLAHVRNDHGIVNSLTNAANAVCEQLDLAREDLMRVTSASDC